MKTAAVNLPCRRAWMVLIALPLLGIPNAAAQYSVDAQVVAGGGGSSTGGVFSVTGTIGQADAGPVLSGGVYTWSGGFWSLVSVIQTPGAPLLAVTRHPDRSVTVSWPAPSPGFSLQQNLTLDPAGWSAADYPVSDDGGTRSITITHPVGSLFLRLTR